MIRGVSYKGGSSKRDVKLGKRVRMFVFFYYRGVCCSFGF